MNIHMFCHKRPGLLLSIMRTLDSVGLDVQQAVISGFNGFAMDVFRAEVCAQQMSSPNLSIIDFTHFLLLNSCARARGLVLQQCTEGQEVHPEQIKALLLQSAGFTESTEAAAGNC